MNNYLEGYDYALWVYVPYLKNTSWGAVLTQHDCVTLKEWSDQDHKKRGVVNGIELESESGNKFYLATTKILDESSIEYIRDIIKDCIKESPYKDDKI